MPQGMYIENPDNGTWRAKPQSDGSFNVNVSNFPNPQTIAGSVSVSNLPVTQPVSGSVSVSNFPSTQTVTGVVAADESAPAIGDIVRGSRTTTGTLATIPSGRVFRGSAEVSCSIAVVGNSLPSITDGTNVIIQCEAIGLALTSLANASNISDVYIAGPATITFTAGASGSSSGSIAGRLL